jgi:hypothetical protein
MQGAREAEMMIVEAYAALLLGFLSIERLVICSASNDSLQFVDYIMSVLVAFNFLTVCLLQQYEGSRSHFQLPSK